jgi:transposase
MPKPLITVELWKSLNLYCPRAGAAARRQATHPDRDLLRGILFMLSTGLPWETLPPEMGCGSRITSGAACARGTRQASASVSTACSATASAKQTAATAREPRSTRRACLPPGRGDGEESDGSRQRW